MDGNNMYRFPAVMSNNLLGKIDPRSMERFYRWSLAGLDVVIDPYTSSKRADRMTMHSDRLRYRHPGAFEISTVQQHKTQTFMQIQHTQGQTLA